VRTNWAASPALEADGHFVVGTPIRWENVVLTKAPGCKGCTLEGEEVCAWSILGACPASQSASVTFPSSATLDHESKVSQLQLVCSASALEISVIQSKDSQDFKWLAQVRGIPIPNQPELFYFRAPDELLTQRLWRLRLKFLLSSVNVTTIRAQTLVLSFDKPSRRGSKGDRSLSKGEVMACSNMP
jgi:hypothetical protein